MAIKNYDPDIRQGIHTVRITIQQCGYVGHIMMKISGNCKGMDVLGIDFECEDEDTLRENDCNLRYDEEYGYFSATLKDRRLPWADNFWFGSSVTKLSDRYTWFTEKKFHWFLSVEPILEDLGPMDADAPKPEWIIVGAETGKRKDKVVPERAWIESLLAECRKYGIPIFMKSSLADIWGEPLIQEFPKELGRKVCVDG